MASRRKLEEEIARTKDPGTRKQLQELLDKREKRRMETKSSIGRFINDFFHETKETQDTVRVMVVIFIIVAILIVAMSLLSLL